MIVLNFLNEVKYLDLLDIVYLKIRYHDFVFLLNDDFHFINAISLKVDLPRLYFYKP